MTNRRRIRTLLIVAILAIGSSIGWQLVPSTVRAQERDERFARLKAAAVADRSVDDRDRSFDRERRRPSVLRDGYISDPLADAGNFFDGFTRYNGLVRGRRHDDVLRLRQLRVGKQRLAKFL